VTLWSFQNISGKGETDIRYANGEIRMRIAMSAAATGAWHQSPITVIRHIRMCPQWTKTRLVVCCCWSSRPPMWNMLLPSLHLVDHYTRLWLSLRRCIVIFSYAPAAWMLCETGIVFGDDIV